MVPTSGLYSGEKQVLKFVSNLISVLTQCVIFLTQNEKSEEATHGDFDDF